MSIEGFPRRFEEPQKKPGENIERDNENLRNELKEIYAKLADINKQKGSLPREWQLRESIYKKYENESVYTREEKIHQEIQQELSHPGWIESEKKFEDLESEKKKLEARRDEIDKKLGLQPFDKIFNEYGDGPKRTEDIPDIGPVICMEGKALGFEPDGRITGEYSTLSSSTDGMVFEIRMNIEFNGETIEPFTVTTKDRRFAVDHTISNPDIVTLIKNKLSTRKRELWNWSDDITLRRVS